MFEAAFGMPSIGKAVDDFCKRLGNHSSSEYDLMKGEEDANFASPSRYIQGENALFENAKRFLNWAIIQFFSVTN